MRTASLLMWSLASIAVAATKPPYPPSPRIREAKFDFSTLGRRAPGSDNWPLTWADDDHQYTAWGDGGGFGGTNRDGRVGLGIARVEGPADAYRGVNVWGGKNPEAPAAFPGKSYGILSVGGILYMWASPDPSPHLVEARLAKSADKGRSWQKAPWAFTFADELTIPTFLQFGKDYAGARDGYVYSYYIRPRWGPGRATVPAQLAGFDVHKPGEVHLSRVPRERLLDRAACEFFAGLDDRGAPRWASDLAAKRPVFADPAGVGWNLSVLYNPGLRRYLLATEHSRTSRGCMGLFDAPEPWGPWTTVLYNDAWGEGHVPLTAFRFNFSPKWLSADGRRFTFVFTGVGENDAWNTLRGEFILAP